MSALPCPPDAVPVQHEDYTHWETDEWLSYEVNDLPAECWNCADCGVPIGWLLVDDDEGRGRDGLSWHAAFIRPDANPAAPDAEVWCEDCAPEV